MNYSAKEDDITDMEEFGNDYVDNTIIEKTDGTFYACGMGVGDKSVVLPQYYEVSELDTVCSSEFLLLDWNEEMLDRKQREYIERKESQSERLFLQAKNEALLEEIDKNYDMEKLKRKVPRFSEDDKINETYYHAIKTLDTTGFLPDGNYCFWYYDEPENYLETKEKLGGFGIAVCDVDVDGKKEMLIGLRKELSEPYGVLIYRYNEEQRKFEVENGFSSRINFYNNGYVEEYWTMPNYDQPAFTIYQYNPALDTFEKMFWINGIEDVGIDDYFPTEQDLDGNGKGYIMSVDGKETYVDDAAYQKMMEQYIDLNKRIDVEWVDFFE